MHKCLTAADFDPGLPCHATHSFIHSFIRSGRQTGRQTDPENSIQNFIKATSYGHIKQMDAICIGWEGQEERARAGERGRESAGAPHQKVV